MKVTELCVVLLASVELGWGCVPAAKKVVAKAVSNSVWERVLGGKPSYGPEAMPGPGKGQFADNGGRPVENPSDLNCNFEADCCWTQEQAHDQLDYAKAGGIPDRSKARAAFGDEGPVGDSKYMFLSNMGAIPATHNAQYRSCPVKCAKDGEAEVRLKMWRNEPTLKLDACVRNVGTEGPGICVPFVLENGGPSAVARINAIDPGQEIVIRGAGLVNAVDLMLIDDITVNYDTDCGDGGEVDCEAYPDDPDCAVDCDAYPDYPECADGGGGGGSGGGGSGGKSKGKTEEYPDYNSGGKSAPKSKGKSGGGGGGGGGGAAAIKAADKVMCQKISCGNGDLCGWGAGGNAADNFDGRDGRKQWKNRLTGVRPLKKSETTGYRGEDTPDYIGAYLKPKNEARMEVTGFKAPEPRLVDFWIYRATEGMALEACVSASDCVPLVDPTKVSKNARRWVRKALELEPGTDFLSVQSFNEGKNQGGVAFTQIKITDLDGNDVCGPLRNKARRRRNRFNRRRSRTN